MPSEISKTYKSGFVLTEQALRKIWECCEQRFLTLKHSTKYIKLEATLYDASFISTQNIDEIFTLENGGAKRISKLNFMIRDIEKDPATSIEITFQNGHENISSWTSMTLLVRSDNRDWVFLAANDLEGRIKPIEVFALEHFANHRFVLPIFIGIGMLVAFNAFPSNGIVLRKLCEIELAMKTLPPLNPIKVIVDIEKAKLTRTMSDLIPFFIAAYIIPLFLGYLLGEIIPKIFQSYNFCWGESLSLYNKRQEWKKIFWVGGILAIVASIIAGLILKNYLHA